MAGKLIVDTIDTDNAFITLNVQQSLIATMNVSGIYSNTGVKMIGANGTISNTAITGNIISSQITSVANTQLTGLIEAAQIGSANATLITSGTLPTARLPAGSVLQVVQTVKTNSFSTSTGSFIDITGLSVSITPQSASNKILVSAIIYIGMASGNARLNLVRGSTNIAQSTSGTANQTLMGNQGGAYNGQTLPILFYDSPATTSATTYKIQLNAEGSAMTIGVRATDNYYGGICTITVMEIAG